MKKFFCLLTTLFAFCIASTTGFSNSYGILSFEGMSDRGVKVEFPEEWMPVENDGCEINDFGFVHQDLARECKIFIGTIDEEESVEENLQFGCGQIISQLYHHEALYEPSVAVQQDNHWHTFTICKNGVETSVGLYTYALGEFLIGVLIENVCSEPCLSEDINTFVEKIQLVTLDAEQA